MPKKGEGPERENVDKPVGKKKLARITTLRTVASKVGITRKRPIEVKRSKTGSRVLQTPKRVWYNPLTWRHRPPVPNYKSLPKARLLFWFVLKLIWKNKKLFGGIVLIYGLLNVVLVRGISGSSNLSSIKSVLDGGVTGIGGKAVNSTLSFGYLLASSGSSNTATSGIYQAILLVVCSLAFIWALRSVLANQQARTRDSFYKGMYPLIPFLLLFLLMCVQLLPLTIGGALFSLVVSTGVAAHFWEEALWFVFFILLASWSFRMITASLFALYIVTLPDMTPLRAYRSAKQLVYGRRLLIWRKLIFLPIALLLIAGVIEVPLILFITPVAEWALFIITMVSMPIVHGYLYNLYRDML